MKMNKVPKVAAVFALLLLPTFASAQYKELKYKSLAAFVADVRLELPRRGTDGFKKPTAEDRANFNTAVQSLFEGDLAKSAKSASAAGYSLVIVKAGDSKKSYHVLYENLKGFRGLGTYIVDGAFTRNLVIQVPHPLFDAGTLEQGVAVFTETGSRALFISGTHRCANTEVSSCDGTSAACGTRGPYPVSDVAHFTENYFQEAHAATLKLTPTPIAVSLHGNVNETLPDVTVSDGTSASAPAGALVNRFAEESAKGGVTAGSCNLEGGPEYTLCGGTNVQGRLSNKSPNPCTTRARRGTGLFLHVEQKGNVRRNPKPVVDALKTLIPARN
jgi:hypothetical protein